MSTLEPRQPYSDEELRTLYPSDLELRNVQVIFRHGERTPTAVRLENAGVPRFWPYCHSAKAFTAAVLDHGQRWDQLRFQRRIESFGESGDAVVASGPRREIDGICLQGQLTDRGRETTLAMGERLRMLYVDKLGFLPKHLENVNKICFLRMTPIPRAGESLQQVFTGLYPLSFRNPNDIPTVHTRNPQDENLYPNDAACRRFNQLARSFAKLAAETHNDSPEMQYLQEKIGKWMPEGSKVAVDGHPRLSGLMDTTNAVLAHADPDSLPVEFHDPEVRRIMNDINVDEWFRGYSQSSEYRRLGVGSLMGDIKDRALQTVKGRSSVKIGLFGCHDTTIAGLLATMGDFDNIWPPFTSSIAFETFQARDRRMGRLRSLFLGNKPEDGWYVRIRYNDQVVVPKTCRKPGNHKEGDESFCTMAAFRDMCEKVAPKNWKYECLQNMQPGIPPFEAVE